MIFGFKYNTILGSIIILSENQKITNISFNHCAKIYNKNETELIYNTYIQIDEYLKRKRKYFDIPINPKGTDFMKKVWKQLSKIPYGETRSYKDIAISIGNPKAYRAVGIANNKNPIPIIIPCHRVIGCNGKLIGYSGGLIIKKTLLDIENFKKIK